MGLRHPQSLALFLLQLTRLFLDAPIGRYLVRQALLLRGGQSIGLGLEPLLTLGLGALLGREFLLFPALRLGGQPLLLLAYLFPFGVHPACLLLGQALGLRGLGRGLPGLALLLCLLPGQ